MSTPRVNLCVVLSDAKRIIKANRRHFSALALLFVLPLSFSSIVYPSFSHPTSIISTYNRLFSSFTPPVPEREETPVFPKSDVIFTLLRSLFGLLFTFFTTASITHSTWNGFLGKPLNFTSSLKSTLVSILPLAATFIVSLLILGLIIFSVGFLSGMVYGGILLYGAKTDNSNVYSLGFVVLLTVLVLGVMIYIQTEWYLAYAVVVLESKWGFEPLKRSSYLVKGKKWVAFLILVYFELSIGLMSAIYSTSVPSLIDGGSFGWDFVLMTVLFTVFTTALRLYSVAATAVLFIYCKTLCGELGSEIVGANAFALPYVRLPVDGDEKVPKVVYIV